MSVVLAEGWIDDGEGDDYWLEGRPVRVEVEPADSDRKIRLGVMVGDRLSESVGLYLTPSSARDLLVAVGVAIDGLERREE